MIRVLLIILLLCSNAFAVDTWMCFDDDKNGVLGILKDSGVIDRDCNHEASASEGGPDCDDTLWNVYKGSYSTNGCAGGEYRICDPGGAGTYSACTSAAIATAGYNQYYVSGSGSGTTCSAASPCAVTAVSSGGAVTIVNPAEIIFIGSSDVTGSLGFSTQLAGNSTSVKNIFRKDPRATGKFNLTGGSTISSIYVGHNNWEIVGHDLTGQTSVNNPGINVSANNANVHGNWIHDLQCSNSNNCSGIYANENGSNRWLHDNLIVDAGYDGSLTLIGDNRQNVFGIRGFRNDGDIYEKNIVGYSHAPKTVPYEKQGSGISVKHGNSIAEIDAKTPTEIRYNVIVNEERTGIAPNSGGVKVHGNLIINAAQSIAVGPGGDGGTASWKNIRVTNNTIVAYSRDAGGTLGFAGAVTETTDASTLNGGVIVSGNVVVDSAQTTYGTGNNYALVSIDHYGVDARYTATQVTLRVFSFLNNCYYNSAIPALTAGMNVYGDSSFGALGTREAFTGWQASPYLYDVTGTVNANPTLDNEYRVTTNCPIGTLGWEAEWPTASSPSTPGEKRKGQLNYSGRKGQ